MFDLEESLPYYKSETPHGSLFLRETHSEMDWMRFQVGKKVHERRNYLDRAMIGRGFSGYVVVFWLLGYGTTAHEAITMVYNRNGH